ncbi:peptidoglycan-binding domain-containing protein [Aerosakkonema funiforme]|uniref:Peptidoglycan-binding protein n=1 Tax=Aerosakkonema funiforme FACHB-1375 TaxID=2949571 RepID=A0A926ZH91_9CYAN|nr:peptidoglycan-binding domain-containing protein [Aerosakkonema funiforme]MBD2183038.1 peptidoglycan-binding protein [Aerosakkonema funiforme FACHB-1375]
MSSIQIYEFSREFDETEKDGKTVSGGYKNEVGPGTRDVPPKIKEAVKRGDFRILDSYEPQKGEFALIGREINDKYSVLAVATSLTEDGSRPGVCYRYFWLEKRQDEDIDGIGTLLIWWKKVGEPKFEFNWHKKNLDFYRANTYSRNDFYQKQSQYHSEVENTIDQINYSSYELKNNGKKISYEVWHCVALYFDKSSTFSISWAWNVKKLDKNQIFTMIYYADCKFEINKLQPRKPNPDPDPLDHINWETLKNCLSELAKNESSFNQTNLKIVIDYLKKYPIRSWNWSQINDQKILRQTTTPSGARYKALRAILRGEIIQDWLDWLRKSSNQTFQETSLTIQAALLRASCNENIAYNQLLSNMDEGMSQMLLKCTSENTLNSQYENIEWLLVKSNTVLSSDFVNYTWSSYLQRYARNLVSLLIAEDMPRSDNFYTKIRETLNQWAVQGKASGKYPLFPEYKKLALLFEKIQDFNLSALFYQLSEGDVPEDIYENVKVKIIRLRKRRKNVGIRLIWAAVIVAIALAGGISFEILFPKTNTVSVKNNSILARNFERDLDLWDNTGNSEAKQRLIQFLKDELPDILKDKNNPENDESRKNDSIAKTNTFIKNAFTPTVSLSQEPTKNNHIKSDSPSADDIKIIQQMLKSIKYTSNSVKLPFYSGDITGEFDEKTTEAINDFQRLKMQLKPKDITGTVGPGTWEKLQDLFRDEQVKPVKEFMIKSFEEGKNDDEIKVKINKLKSCKQDPKKAIDFISCLNSENKTPKTEK